MRTGNKTAIVVFILVVALSLAALADLLLQRFRQGDVYPPYSSLRSDPLGSKAYFDALSGIKGLKVERSFLDMPLLGAGRDTLLMLLNVHDRALERMPQKELEVLEEFVRSGGRIVITLKPEFRRKPGKSAEGGLCEPDEEDGIDEVSEEKSGDGQKKPGKKHYASLLWQWGLGVAMHEDETMTHKPAAFNEMASRASGVSVPQLPEGMSWHSALFFEEKAEGWQVLYTVRGKAVMVERRMGEGSVVIASDSYFTSNEAMLRERRPSLLAWLVGPHHRIIFDESHFGISQTRNTASLVFGYRLHYAVFAALLLSVLYIWKNSAGLVPPLRPASGEDGVTAGRDHRAGFVSLLRRTIPARDLLGHCIAEWRHSLPERRLPWTRIEETEHYMKPLTVGPIDPERQADAYRRITEILSERGKHEQ